MAKKNENATYILDSKVSLPNKLLQDDGTITDITGKTVINPVDSYDNKPALPNKFLNPDGTYSTLNEIIASMVDTSIYVIVDELPAEGDPQKIYLVADGKGGFVEYHWTGEKWDPIGMIEFDLSNYSTTQEMMNAIEASALQTLNAAKTYTNEQMKHVVPLQSFPASVDTTHSTEAFFNSIKAINPAVGTYYLGSVELTDMPQGLTEAEVQVVVYSNKVLYATMKSVDIAPYEWECNSYDYQGWQASGTETLESAKTYTDTKTSAAVTSANGYTDNAIQTSITRVLGGSY